MKFKITMKDPDGFADSISRAAQESVESVNGVNDEEKSDLVDGRSEELKEAVKKWFEYEEYLRVEIDTDTGTIRVCKAEE